jgi:cysteinyl-tRNA synthetase
MNIYITNTLTGKKELFTPIQPQHVSIYVCGVTLYDHIHIGHLKSILSFEVMRNYFKALGYKVTYVRNITDVDDKIITKAISQKTDPLSLVNHYIDSFHQQLDSLEINPPDIEPRVTQSLNQITEFISTLQNKGFAYTTNDGIYFDTSKMNIETYPLSKKVAKDMQEVSRLDTFDRKNKADFALWKEDEAYGFKSNIFKKLGRPGWHIECSAMHYKALGKQFDIHGGGRDLIFPHHENEISQSFAHNGVNPANYWVHNGMMTKDGKKLSKSLGNSIYVHELTQKFSNQGLKMFLLKSHYSFSQEFLEQELLESHQRWSQFIENISTYQLTNKKSNIYEESLKLLSDDFNTPNVVALLYKSFKDLQITKSLEQALDIFKVLQLLSIVSDQKNLHDYSLEKPSLDILKLMEDRWILKLNKDYKNADLIRQQILESGWVIKDYPTRYIYYKHITI